MSALVLGLGQPGSLRRRSGSPRDSKVETRPARARRCRTLMDGGTQGLSLLPHISGYSRLLVIDAVDAGEAPGTLLRVEGRALRNLPGKATVHQLGFADLMVAMELLGESPEEIVVVGVQPFSTEWSAELTPPVQETLGPLLDAVIEQLKAWSACHQATDSGMEVKYEFQGSR